MDQGACSNPSDTKALFSFSFALVNSNKNYDDFYHQSVEIKYVLLQQYKRETYSGNHGFFGHSELLFSFFG